MSFVPNEELQGRERLNLAPMIDFLFLMLMFFASLAISRVATKDTEIDLVKVEPETKTSVAQADIDHKVITVSINADGEYKWITEMRDYSMGSSEEIARELNQQYEQGLLPADKERTVVLLRVDRKATWEPILKVIFAVRETGFPVHPVYEPDSQEATASAGHDAHESRS